MENDSIIYADRQQKQIYLRNEILLGGLNAQEFKKYCNELRPDGGNNIDVWTLEELKNIVSEFRQHSILNLDGLSLNETQEIKNFDSTIHNIEENELTTSEVITGRKKTLFLYNEDFTSINKKEEISLKKELQAKKFEGTILNQEPNIVINISEPKVIKGSILKPSYISYKITTSPWNWTVRRRYSDFYWLRGILMKLYPGVILPPIPTKKAKRNLEQNYVKRRLNFFEKFLKNCLLSDDIKSCEYFEYFLSTADEDAWRKQMKAGERLQKISTLKNIRSLEGKIDLEINEDIKQYINRSIEFTNQANPLYKKLRNHSKQLMIDFSQISDTMFNMGETFGNLYQVSSAFNKRINIGNNDMLDNIYLSLNNLFMSWGETMFNQLKHIQDELCNFFKYEQFEIKSIKEALKSRHSVGYDYSKSKHELLTKKEKMFHIGDYTRWEIPFQKLQDVNVNELIKNKEMAFDLMIPKESMKVEQLREYFAFVNKKTYTEIGRVLSSKNLSYIENFAEFAKNQANLTADNTHFVKCMAYLTESGFKKNLEKDERMLLSKASIIKINKDPIILDNVQE